MEELDSCVLLSWFVHLRLDDLVRDEAIFDRRRGCLLARAPFAAFDEGVRALWQAAPIRGET